VTALTKHGCSGASMTNHGGWTGKLLDVDLSTARVGDIDTRDYVPEYVGGLGIAAKIAWDDIPPGVGPFDPGNILFVMVGPLTGTLASGGGRVLVAGIAPQQKPSVFSRSSMGGHWGAELKYAGYDGVIVRGRADSPVYIWVSDGKAEIRDASALWGQGTYYTTSTLRSRHGRGTRVVSCGQAGENLCRFACVQTETGNAAGQGGFGAVMGSKNLKAIAVRGSLGVPVAHRSRLLQLALQASREALTPRRPANPARARQESGLASRQRKCGFCISRCAHTLFMNVPGETNGGLRTVAQQCFGYRSSQRGHLEARATTADLGINGWELAYGIIPWLQMCKQHGLVDAIGGMPIPVPDKPVLYNRDVAPTSGEFLLMLLDKVAYRRDEMGDALAQGACCASERLFGGQGAHLLDRIYPRRAGQTSHWTSHWGTGGTVYFPYWLVPVLQWCVDTRDPASDSTHHYTTHALRYLPEHGAEKGPLTWDQVRAVSAKVYGNADVFDPQYSYGYPETKVIPAAYHHDKGMLVESLVLCESEQPRVFSMETPDHAADTALMSKLFSAVTGLETSEGELDKAGERIFSLLRAIDVRNHNRSRSDDEFAAETLSHPAFTDNVSLDLSEFGKMLDAYYVHRGWNPANGYPTRNKLVQLGLSDVADELESRGKLG